MDFDTPREIEDKIGRRRKVLAIIVAAVPVMLGTAMSQDTSNPELHTHEAYLEEVTRTTALPITDPVAIFGFVLECLTDRVRVYPTGNYYYFSFVHNGMPYVGNIRIDALSRDSGQVPFAYYPDLTPWANVEAEPVPGGVGVILDASHGVTIERLEPLVYRVAYGPESVVFELNDLSHVKPPANALGLDERFVGPIFDESGLRFFLVYNPRLKIFHYILDETVVILDEFVPSRRTNRIVIGKRTGFAFYRDHRLDRKILIGVFEGNRQANNYFDGPSDQQPDNFIEGETLREIILEAEPGLEGQIDRLGRTPDYARSFTIDPYLDYRTEDDLSVIHHCATSKRIPSALYYNCFAGG